MSHISRATPFELDSTSTSGFSLPFLLPCPCAHGGFDVTVVANGASLAAGNARFSLVGELQKLFGHLALSEKQVRRDTQRRVYRQQ